MVPNSLQWRLIDLCVKQINRRLLFSVHRGVWWRQTALIKLTVHHNCFFFGGIKITMNTEGGKKMFFHNKSSGEKRSDICCDMFPICYHLRCVVLETFVRHFHFALLHSSFFIPSPTRSLKPPLLRNRMNS